LVRQPVEVVAVPLIAIQGIGDRRAELLAQLGVDSMARLATAVPETIAAELPGVSLRMAREFVAEARTLLIRN
jgi:predicted flap endonuclease-1-like 5' DNA nuclease